MGAWSSSGFSMKLDRIGEMLGELAYIDGALDYLGELRNAYYTYEREERNRDIFTTDYSIGYHESIELGATHPFDKHYMSRERGHYYSNYPFDEEIREEIESLRGPARDWGQSIADGIRSRVEDVTNPIVANFIVVAEALADEIHVPFQTQARHDFGRLRATLSDWDGAAATSFDSNFYTPFGQCVDNQAWLAGEVAKHVGACAGLLNLARTSLMNIVDAVEDALDDQLQKRKDDNRAPSLAEVLTMVSTMAGLLAIVTMPIPAASAAIGVVSTLTGYAADAVPDGDGTEVQIEAASAEEVAERLNDLVVTLMSDNDAHWDTLREQVMTLDGHVDGILDEGLLAPERPSLADGVRAGEFVHG